MFFKMQFLMVLFAILIVAIQNANGCQISSYNEQCHCVSNGAEFEMYCPPVESVNTKSFKIKYISRSYVQITCANNPSWLDFQYEIRRATKEVTKLSLLNCSLEENTNLMEVARLVGAENASILIFSNNLKHKSLTLRKNHLQGFSNVKRLEISQNHLLGDLNEDLLEPLPKLETIILLSNNIKSIPQNFFTYVPQLKALELGSNKIQSFHPETFKSLKNLIFLNLWNNEINELSNITFHGLVSLTSLDLHKNKLKSLPPGIFDELEKLEIVNLSGTQLESLPGTLFQKNQRLDRVKLQFEPLLTTLPSGLFSNLKKLRSVQCEGSKLESLPEDLFQGSPEVKELYFYGNVLTTLPNKIFEGLGNLQKLFLEGNRIEYLPDNIFSSNEKLEELVLNHNQIKNISSSLLVGLRSLKILKMRNNSISNIATTAFTSLVTVEEIDLSHNNISDIQVLDDDYMVLSVFHRCENLRKMDLSYNKISKIFSDWTKQPSKKFAFLNLSFNQIERIYESDMDFKQREEFKVNLSNNKISRIDMSNAFEYSFLQEVRSRIQVILTNNPLKCNCFLYDFIRYLDGSRPELRRKLEIEIGPLECSSPEEIKGTLLSDLKSTAYRCIASDLEEYVGVCPELCSRWINPHDYKLIFDCAFKNLTEAPKTMCNFVSAAYINEVNLTGNFIRNIPNMNQTGYNRVEKLVLSHNNISAITNNIFSPTLLTLELDHNKITTLSSAVLAHLKNSTLKNITLSGNPWKCDCDSRDFHHYIQSDLPKGKSRILDVDKITCQNLKKVLKTITVSELCPAETEMIVGISLTIAILGLTIGALAALYYRYQREIKVWLYAHEMFLWFVTEEELDKDKPYDAFISYSHKDEEFVVNELVPKLESGPRPFKLCIHFRDWLAGEWIPSQIATSVKNSKRTIVVVSPNFVQSEWGRLEFRTAHSQALNEGRGRVVVILYGDIGPTDQLEPELKAYLSMNTYAKWGDPWFWDKLRYFLPHKHDLLDKPRGSKLFKKQHASAQLKFNKCETDKIPENGMTPMTEKALTIDVYKNNSQNVNIFNDLSDDETKKLNSSC